MKLFPLAAIGFAGMATIATAALSASDDQSNVQIFYDLLSDPGSAELVENFKQVTSENWESVGDYSGDKETRDGFIGQLGGFAQLIPDLDWDVQAMHQDGNFVTVRSRATGTPVAPFFGVDGEGRSFDIMAIDIHELEDGKIIRTYHVEDWGTAMRQLQGDSSR